MEYSSSPYTTTTQLKYPPPPSKQTSSSSSTTDSNNNPERSMFTTLTQLFKLCHACGDGEESATKPPTE